MKDYGSHPHSLLYVGSLTSLLTPDQLWKAMSMQRETHQLQGEIDGKEKAGGEEPVSMEEEARGHVLSDAIQGPPHLLTGLCGGPFSNLK